MLATLSELKTYLGITWSDSDALLTIFLQGADAAIIKYIGRWIEAANYIEQYDGKAQLMFNLKQYPVNSVTSISENDGTFTTPVRTVVDADDYSVDSDTWIVNFLYPMERGFKNYQVVYNAWYETVPAELKLICLQLAAKAWNRKGAEGIKSETVAWDSLVFDVSVLWDEAILLLNEYKDVSF